MLGRLRLRQPPCTPCLLATQELSLCRAQCQIHPSHCHSPSICTTPHYRAATCCTCATCATTCHSTCCTTYVNHASDPTWAIAQNPWSHATDRSAANAYHMTTASHQKWRRRNVQRGRRIPNPKPGTSTTPTEDQRQGQSQSHSRTDMQIDVHPQAIILCNLITPRRRH
jgi:hypothetical protein